MNRTNLILTGAFFVFIGGCSQPTLSEQINSNCDVFCAGFRGCLQGAGCTLVSEDASQTFCIDQCRGIATMMTQAQLDETLVCLRCIDGEIDPESCTVSTFMAATGMTCLARCHAGGPSFFIEEFTQALQIEQAQMPPLYTCPTP